jgi:hypothetical protein
MAAEVETSGEDGMDEDIFPAPEQYSVPRDPKKYGNGFGNTNVLSKKKNVCVARTVMDMERGFCWDRFT